MNQLIKKYSRFRKQNLSSRKLLKITWTIMYYKEIQQNLPQFVKNTYYSQNTLVEVILTD